MKDGYSFDINSENARKTYENVFRSYIRIFERMGLTPVPVRADSGAIGGNMSHEFQILADTGESTLYYDKRMLSASDEELMTLFAVSEEKYDPAAAVGRELSVSRGIEVGHIFCFGTKYSKAMNAFVFDEKGEKVFPEMGSYGIGVSRLAAAIIEASHDDRGIVWPESTAPFDVTVLNLNMKNDKCTAMAAGICQALSSGKEVLYDDRDISVGEKLTDADLIGIPYQILIGPKKAAGGTAELKNRKTGEVREMSSDEVIGRFLS
jgi:prolyl-tRNA synthetase